MALPKHKRKDNTHLTVTERERERSDNKNTTATKADLSPQFKALHSFQRSYNGKERIKRQIAVIETQHFATKANSRARQYKSCNTTAEYNLT